MLYHLPCFLDFQTLKLCFDKKFYIIRGNKINSIVYTNTERRYSYEYSRKNRDIKKRNWTKES